MLQLQERRQLKFLGQIIKNLLIELIKIPQLLLQQLQLNHLPKLLQFLILQFNLFQIVLQQLQQQRFRFANQTPKINLIEKIMTLKKIKILKIILN